MAVKQEEAGQRGSRVLMKAARAADGASIRSTLFLCATRTRSVVDAIRRIDGQRYILDPDFQRDFVWPEDKQSKLIESCVMRILSLFSIWLKRVTGASS